MEEILRKILLLGIILSIGLSSQGCFMAMAGFNAGMQTPMPSSARGSLIRLKDRIKEKQEETDPVWKPDNMTEVVDPYWGKQ